jgi:hypothetical protein
LYIMPSAAGSVIVHGPVRGTRLSCSLSRGSVEVQPCGAALSYASHRASFYQQGSNSRVSACLSLSQLVFHSHYRIRKRFESFIALPCCHRVSALGKADIDDVRVWLSSSIPQTYDIRGSIPCPLDFPKALKVFHGRLSPYRQRYMVYVVREDPPTLRQSPKPPTSLSSGQA